MDFWFDLWAVVLKVSHVNSQSQHLVANIFMGNLYKSLHSAPALKKFKDYFTQITGLLGILSLAPYLTMNSLYVFVRNFLQMHFFHELYCFSLCLFQGLCLYASPLDTIRLTFICIFLLFQKLSNLNEVSLLWAVSPNCCLLWMSKGRHVECMMSIFSKPPEMTVFLHRNTGSPGYFSSNTNDLITWLELPQTNLRSLELCSFGLRTAGRRLKVVIFTSIAIAEEG